MKTVFHNPFACWRQHTLRCVAGLLVLLFLSACGQQNPPTAQGYLYVGLGGYLGQFDLQTGDIMPVTRLADVRIHRVSRFGESGLVLTVEDARRGNERWRVLRFDPRSKRSSFLMSGIVVAEVPEFGGLVVDDGQRLTLVRDTGQQLAQSMLHERSLRDRVPNVLPCGHELLLQTAGSENAPIRRIGIGEDGVAFVDNESMEELSDACTLEGAICIDASARLLCREAGQAAEGTRYRLVSLDDGQVEDVVPLPGSLRAHAVSYIPDADTVVFSGRRKNWFTQREEYPVLTYRLSDGETTEIASNQYLGQSAVYQRFGLSSRR